MADVRSTQWQTQNSTTTGIASSTTALAANFGRGAWMIQNLGQNKLFVLQGTGASATNFNVVLKAGSADDDGTGGTYAQEAGAIYTGVVTIAGTSPRYVVTEMYS